MMLMAVLLAWLPVALDYPDSLSLWLIAFGLMALYRAEIHRRRR